MSNQESDAKGKVFFFTETSDQKTGFPIELKYLLALLIIIAGFYGFKRKLKV